MQSATNRTTQGDQVDPQLATGDLNRGLRRLRILAEALTMGTLQTPEGVDDFCAGKGEVELTFIALEDVRDEIAEVAGLVEKSITKVEEALVDLRSKKQEQLVKSGR
jgi:hypothetical protein